MRRISTRLRRTPSFSGLAPASAATSRTKQAVKSANTRAEVLLRRELWRRGLRYRLHLRELPGRPDVVLSASQVAIFCDGDFWHGRHWRTRRARLLRGANSRYWIAKIRTNIARDHRTDRHLRRLGWMVVRLWETDILTDTESAADAVCQAVKGRRRRFADVGAAGKSNRR